MKNLLTATMPALALLALGGCATSGALTTSTETDGVYYSSSDHTTTVASPAPVAYGSQGTIPARALDDTTPVNRATTDDANPDYQGGTSQNGYATGTDYYSNSYNSGLSYYNPSGFNQPYTGPGVSTYNYAPAYGASPSYYGSPYGYSSAFGMGYSPFGYSPFMSYGYSPFGYGYPYGGGFYDPFYSPFGYGSGLSIGFGFGYGAFGGFGSPYGYGYSPFGYGSPYGYGYGRGYYDSYGYYGRPAVYAGRGAAVASPVYNPRVSRGGGSVFNGAAPANNGNVGGRPVGSYSPNSVAMPGGASAGGSGVAMPTRRDGGGGGNIVGQPSYSTPASPNGTSAPNPRRGGFFGGFFGNGTNAGQNASTANPGGGQRSWSQPQYSGQGQPQRRDFGGQPAYGGQPQQRTFSQPSQAQPSYSQPSRSFGGGSFGGGGGGGGGFGGGGGGGRRGGR